MRYSAIIFLAVTTGATAAQSKYDVIGGKQLTPEQIAAKEDQRKALNEQRESAKSACMHYVKMRVSDPSSAKFPATDAERARYSSAVKQKDGSWKVTFTGRARNAFNALIFASFQCRVEPIEVEGERGMYVATAKQIEQ